MIKQTLVLATEDLNKLNIALIASPESLKHLPRTDVCRFDAKFSNDYSAILLFTNTPQGIVLTTIFRDPKGRDLARSEPLALKTMQEEFVWEYQREQYVLNIQRHAVTELTDAAHDHYVESGGVSCPHCRGYNLDTRTPQLETGSVMLRVICTDCAAEWTDHYKLTRVTSDVGPTKNVSPPAVPARESNLLLGDKSKPR